MTDATIASRRLGIAPAAIDCATLQEELREANERHMSAQLEWRAEKQHREIVELDLRQINESLRWWAVITLAWQVTNALEPARYAYTYPASWYAKLAQVAMPPNTLVLWFGLAGILILPLVLLLTVAPRHRLRRSVEGSAIAGLSMAAVGYGFLLWTASRFDLAHLADYYLGNVVMLALQGLLVACWSNSREVRKEEHRKAAATREGLLCADV